MKNFRELQIRAKLHRAESLRKAYDPPLRAIAEGYRATAADIAYGLHQEAVKGHQAVTLGFPQDMPLTIAERFLAKANYLLSEANLKKPLAVRIVFF